MHVRKLRKLILVFIRLKLPTKKYTDEKTIQKSHQNCTHFNSKTNQESILTKIAPILTQKPPIKSQF